MIKFARRWLWCLFLLASSTIRAQVLVTPSVTFDGVAYSYEYTLSNIGTTAVVGFGLDVPAQVRDITSPSGWDSSIVLVGANTLVLWVSTDMPFDLPPSGMLSGFSFISSAPSGEVMFSTLTENFNACEGHTIGPSAVPEPDVWAVLGTGMVGGLLLLRRRWR